MQARSSGEVYRRLFREIQKEQLTWISGRTITPKCRFSGGSMERHDLPGSPQNSVITSARRSTISWIKGEFSQGSGDSMMVRKVEGLGALRHMADVQRPGNRAPIRTRSVLPMSDEEKHTEEFLRQEKMKQAAKIRKTEQQVGRVAGQSLAATDTEFIRKPGSNTADTQKDIASEMTRKSESGADHADIQSTTGEHVDPDAENLLVDEEVRRGLIADSNFRKESKEDIDDKSEETFSQDIKGGHSDHGSFKAL